MYSYWSSSSSSLVLLLIILLINIAYITNLRCHEDIDGSLQLMDNCRSCIIFIDTKRSIKVSPRKTDIYEGSTIQELFLYNNKRRHRRDDANIIIRQQCAREHDGPLYGYDQTHCYCNSNRCNTNIQRCFYEIASKRYFSCYHGSNESHNSLEIYKKCRSCRIQIDSNKIFHYECLTFGEQEHNNHTHCTCQYPMCNQDIGLCQRFQQTPSQPRLNYIHETFLNATYNIFTSTTTTTTTTTTDSTNILITFPSTNHAKEERSIENATFNQVTSLILNETKYVQTIIIEIKNHANYFSLNFHCISSIFCFFISYM
ncbi:unnamed protein product [Adineta steineri]|uniref:Uncharacterized protein n=1 Tax=Adineta steineri TaxID=433720 RepID=A0A814JRJ0_9BILA|nr:unnamed protein product [Adineta steineri]CAF3817615.1 unnamed protein product [Adineta steineri]